MNGMRSEWWRFGLLIALLVLTPIVFRPWWLLVIAAVVYCVLARLFFKGEEGSK